MDKHNSCGFHKVLEDIVESGKKISLRAQGRIGTHVLRVTVWLQ